jgi:secretion/DNA translocation related TadE-like protein
VTDRGSATVWLVGLAGLVLLASTAGVVRGAALVARHRVEAAADLAALAAAARLAGGSGDPCAAARQVAGANGAALTACHLSGRVAEVEAETTLDAGLLGRHRAHARARAGPTSDAPAPAGAG